MIWAGPQNSTGSYRWFRVSTRCYVDNSRAYYNPTERYTRKPLRRTPSLTQLSVLELVYSFPVSTTQQSCMIVDYPKAQPAFWIHVMAHEGFLFFLVAYKAYEHIRFERYTWMGVAKLLFRDSALLFVL